MGVIHLPEGTGKQISQYLEDKTSEISPHLQTEILWTLTGLNIRSVIPFVKKSLYDKLQQL